MSTRRQFALGLAGVALLATLTDTFAQDDKSPIRLLAVPVKSSGYVAE